MASVTPLQEMQEEAKCPICQRYLTDPMTVHCGENFCRVCITEHWEKWDELVNGPLCCPSCRAPVQKGTHRSNQQLAKIVEKIKDPDFKQSEENLGQRDKKTLDLSCDEGGKDIRVVCERSPEHRSHTVLPMEEAAQKHKDVRIPLIRCEVKKFQTLLGIFPELKKRFSNFSQEPVALVETLRTFKANVTLDPDTAHPSLVLSADGKTVKWANMLQDLPKNPERFDSRTCVLGREGFTSEKRYWEVDVGGGRCWAVGVARESVRRKGWNSFYPEEGIWAVELWWGQFRALTEFRTLLPLPQVPRRIGVCLDCKQGQVAFFNASDGSWIYSFPPGSVPRERMRPWFWVWWDTKPQVRLCP